MEAVTVPTEAPALDSPELYANREVSWLQFNERVLELAEDERTPLLERVKFLSIYASNLDEFFMVRVAGLHDQVDAGIDARGPDGLSAPETLERISERHLELCRRLLRDVEAVCQVDDAARTRRQRTEHVAVVVAEVGQAVLGEVLVQRSGEPLVREQQEDPEVLFL